jgi:HSP20 family protein
MEHSCLDLQRQINRLFSEILDEPLGGFRWPTSGELVRQTAFAVPQVDVAETELQVTAELPGLDEKDVQVNLDENLLILQGEKKSEHEEKQKNYHLMERSYGSFQRTIPLPGGVDPTKVKAIFKKGVLHITLPKLPEAKTLRKQIKVEKE